MMFATVEWGARGRVGLLVAVLLIWVTPSLRAQPEESPPLVPTGARVDAGQESDLPAVGARELTVAVVDFRGPVKGAKVAVSRGDQKLSGLTDATGTVRLAVRHSGQWGIVVTADGHLESSGVVRFPLQAELEVELRSLDEGTPAFAEGASDGEVRAWLRKGEALLTEQQYAAARAELSKSLRYLEAADQSQVRALIARCYWLEGATDEGLAELEEAIRLDPQASGLPEVFAAAMNALGRGEDVDRRFAELQTQVPKSVQRRPRARRLPLLDPQTPVAHSVGPLQLRFAHRHPAGSLGVVSDRLGLDRATSSRQQPVDLELESFDLVVPEAYASRSREDRWGVLVWISPTELGGVRSEAIKRLLAERRLIWVGANNAGNPRAYWQRVELALHGAYNVQQLWQIDPDRVFVGGYSGGGRVASMVAWLWPEVFSGAVFWMGTDFFEAVPVPYAPGKMWPARFPKPTRKQLRLVKRRSRFAFVTGDQDFNRSETKAIFLAAQRLGFRNNAFLQIPEANHYYGVRASVLGEALQAIDGDI